jgi:hypothetical protein
MNFLKARGGLKEESDADDKKFKIDPLTAFKQKIADSDDE